MWHDEARPCDLTTQQARVALTGPAGSGRSSAGDWSCGRSAHLPPPCCRASLQGHQNTSRQPAQKEEVSKPDVMPRNSALARAVRWETQMVHSGLASFGDAVGGRRQLCNFTYTELYSPLIPSPSTRYCGPDDRNSAGLGRGRPGRAQRRPWAAPLRAGGRSRRSRKRSPAERSRARHEPAARAAGADLRALGDAGAPRHRRFRQRHPLAQQGRRRPGPRRPGSGRALSSTLVVSTGNRRAGSHQAVPAGAEPAQPRSLGSGNTDHEEVRRGGRAGRRGRRAVSRHCPATLGETAPERGSEGCDEGNGARGFRPPAAKGFPSGRRPVPCGGKCVEVHA